MESIRIDDFGYDHDKQNQRRRRQQQQRFSIHRKCILVIVIFIITCCNIYLRSSSTKIRASIPMQNHDDDDDPKSIHTNEKKIQFYSRHILQAKTATKINQTKTVSNNPPSSHNKT